MRILLLEDDEKLGATIEKSLRLAGYAVDHMRTAKDALHALETENFNLLVLDLGLPDRDGVEVVRELRGKGWSNPILVLTARDAMASRLQALDDGADDYTVKPVAIDELCARVRALTRRQFGALATTFNLGRLEFDMAGRRAALNGVALDLSRREWSVLEYLALNAGKVISKDQLIQAIASWDQDISANAIEAYVHRVRNKLEGSGVIIRTVRGLGYLLNEEVTG